MSDAPVVKLAEALAVAIKTGQRSSWDALVKEHSDIPMTLAGVALFAVEPAIMLGEQIRRLEKRNAELEAELARRPQMKHVGTWQPDIEYGAGEAVMCSGSSWIAHGRTKGVRPGTNAAWSLIARAGRDGKDLR